MLQVEGVLDGEVLGHPELLELGHRPLLTDRDDEVALVELRGVEVEEADPQLRKTLLQRIKRSKVTFEVNKK